MKMNSAKLFKKAMSAHNIFFLGKETQGLGETTGVVSYFCFDVLLILVKR